MKIERKKFKTGTAAIKYFLALDCGTRTADSCDSCEIKRLCDKYFDLMREFGRLNIQIDNDGM
jgi:hypothetical protein